MTKKHIVREVARSLNIPLSQAKAAVDLTIDNIRQVILKHGRIELRNFGVFEVRTRAARKARNPRSNTPVQVPPRRVVTFQPGKLLSAAVINDGQLGH